MGTIFGKETENSVEEEEEMSCPCGLSYQQVRQNHTDLICYLIDNKCQNPYEDEYGDEQVCGRLLTKHPQEGNNISYFLPHLSSNIF